ncbi:hypothetical protein BN11_3350001 [Nostocoides australiense Ben110]|uniref:Uncharacterized protein n=1 Tax=Nostocoides australiense Ben110 TaxID=1193182 RepID=W6JXI6_9MICO|nr:hypothetical protein BN11_3350001 [Tetrasphaera australiensis Ben110]
MVAPHAVCRGLPQHAGGRIRGSGACRPRGTGLQGESGGAATKIPAVALDAKTVTWSMGDLHGIVDVTADGLVVIDARADAEVSSLRLVSSDANGNTLADYSAKTAPDAADPFDLHP